jgi:GSH-dependent disulfide-bond oxidoreductase
MLELYHWEPNGVFLKPLIALAEKEVAYSSRYFDPTRFEQFDAQFPVCVESRLHLEREGPVLVHDREVIASSFFMLEYIAEAFPGPSLLPAQAYDRYRAQACGQMMALLVASAVSALGCARYLAPQLKSLPPEKLRAHIAAIEPAERRASWSAVLDADERALSAARARLVAPLRRLESALSGSSWLAGPHYSIADIDAFATLAPLPELSSELVSATVTPNIMGFLLRMQERPAVRKALTLTRTGKPGQAFVPGAESPRWG